MFCENCGKQLPDDAAFCDNCGTKTAAVTPVQPVKQPFVLTKKHKIIGLVGIGVIVLGILAAVVAVILGKTVRLDKYITITTEGYNHYASVNYEIDYVALFEKVTGENIEDYKSEEKFNALKNAEALADQAVSLRDGLTVEIVYPEGKAKNALSNGDVVNFNLSFDKKAAEKLGIKVKDTTVKYTVEGLAEAKVFDVLSHFEVTFEGYEGNGYAAIVPKETDETVGNIRFKVSEDYNRVEFYIDNSDYSDTIYVGFGIEGFDNDVYDLSNGDKITLTARTDANLVSEHGVILTGLSKEYTVSDLKAPSTYDLLANHTVIFTGVEGEGRAVLSATDSETTVGDLVITTKADNPDYVFWARSDNSDSGSIYLSFDGSSYDLKAGDAITLTCSYDTDYLIEHGVVFENMSKDYTVPTLGKYAAVIADISADSFTAMTAEFTEDLTNRMYEDWSDTVHNSWSSFSEQSIGEDMALHNAIFTTPKNTASSTYNTLWLVFSVTLDDDSMSPTTYYFYYQIRDVIVSADGTMDMQAAYSISKSSGYTDYTQLYNNCIDTFSYNVETLS